MRCSVGPWPTSQALKASHRARSEFLCAFFPTFSFILCFAVRRFCMRRRTARERPARGETSVERRGEPPSPLRCRAACGTGHRTAALRGSARRSQLECLAVRSVRAARHLQCGTQCRAPRASRIATRRRAHRSACVRQPRGGGGITLNGHFYAAQRSPEILFLFSEILERKFYACSFTSPARVYSLSVRSPRRMKKKRAEQYFPKLSDWF